jgi:PTS system nitrogen regulatory IIA component
MEMQVEEKLIDLISRGGVYYHVPGTGPREVITGLIDLIELPPPAMPLETRLTRTSLKIAKPAALDKELLLEAVLEREALMPTAVGHGIALPHPRNPVIPEGGEQFVAIAFLENTVDWKALDGESVHTMLLIVSASAKLHLHTLSQINYFCQQESFRELLKSRASREDIIRVITEAEQGWH